MKKKLSLNFKKTIEIEFGIFFFTLNLEKNLLNLENKIN